MGTINDLITASATRAIRLFEGHPRLRAGKDMLGYWDIAHGCRYYPDGRRVKPGDTITEDDVEPMLNYCMEVEALPVFKTMEKSEWHERDAFASMAYNCGGHNIKNQSRALRMHNAGAPKKDVADAFSGGWYSGRSWGPSTEGPYPEIKNPYYDGAWEWRDGKALWIGEDGHPCEYQQLIRGLLRRRLYEGCLYMGLDGSVACSSDAVSLMRRRVWDEAPDGTMRWEDRVVSRTKFADVYEVAKHYPLSAPATHEDLHEEDVYVHEGQLPPLAPSPPIVVPEIIETPLPDIPDEAPPPVLREQKPKVRAKRPYEDYDEARPPKPIPFSKRVWGWGLAIWGGLQVLWQSLVDPIIGLVAQIPWVGRMAQYSPIEMDDFRAATLVMICGAMVAYVGMTQAKGPLK